MKRRTLMLRSGLACAALAGLVLVAAAGAFAQAVSVGNGYSALEDPKQAGAEAAARAKKALGPQEVKLVLVFDSVGNGAKDKEAMLQGVGSVFDASITYGCSAYAPITQDCNTGTVGVLAVAGGVKVVPAMADLDAGHEACGKKIGEALKASVPESGGRVVLLFGACHVPKNDALVKGVCSVLGETFPVAGGAAKGDLLYHQGKVLAANNLGLLLTGDFKCGLATKNAPGDQTDRVIAVAGEAAAQAMAQTKQAKLVLAFDCGGRRGQMGGQIDKELAAIKAAIGNSPLFGFYGSGEIGPKDNESPPCGVGFHIAVCVISGE